MSLVTVSYNESIIHQCDDDTVFTLNTEGEYLEDDITVIVGEVPTIPSATGVEF